jgi:hypothetical protein
MYLGTGGISDLELIPNSIIATYHDIVTSVTRIAGVKTRDKHFLQPRLAATVKDEHEHYATSLSYFLHKST